MVENYLVALMQVVHAIQRAEKTKRADGRVTVILDEYDLENLSTWHYAENVLERQAEMASKTARYLHLSEVIKSMDREREQLRVALLPDEPSP